MRYIAPLLAVVSVHAAFITTVAAADNSTESALNGWYPCGLSQAPANSTTIDLDDLPFECAELRVPLCHDRICQSDRTIDVFVKRVRPTSKNPKKAVWMLEGGPGASSVACKSSQSRFAWAFVASEY
ncbi:hypothetical protein PINS_up011590 [Pythium insidiosum]|nr:hypothetical protein PINS_up011590 [Pythium insidiosum]